MGNAVSFATQGYEVRPLFSREELDRLRHCVAGHMERVASALLKPHAETEPDAPFDQRIERIARHDLSLAQLLATAVATDAQRAAEVVALERHRGLSAAAEMLAGCRLGDRVCRFRVDSPSLIPRRALWQSDVVEISGPCSPVAIAAWIPLGDDGLGAGGVEIAAGRRDAPLPHRRQSGGFGIPDGELADQAIVTPEVPAGHCLFIDRFTPYRTRPASGDRTGWSLVIWMKPAEAGD